MNSKIGLANSLRGFGTGRMGYFGGKLNKINCPILLITGELDTKFTTINQEMVERFRSANHRIIKNAGHNTHIEEQGRFVLITNDFLLKM